MSKQKPSLQNWQLTSYLSAGNAEYIEDLYDQFLQDPNRVSGEWRTYFSTLANGYRRRRNCRISRIIRFKNNFDSWPDSQRWLPATSACAASGSGGSIDHCLPPFWAFECQN